MTVASARRRQSSLRNEPQILLGNQPVSQEIVVDNGVQRLSREPLAFDREPHELHFNHVTDCRSQLGGETPAAQWQEARPEARGFLWSRPKAWLKLEHGHAGGGRKSNARSEQAAPSFWPSIVFLTADKLLQRRKPGTFPGFAAVIT